MIGLVVGVLSGLSHIWVIIVLVLSPIGGIIWFAVDVAGTPDDGNSATPAGNASLEAAAQR